MEDTSSVDEQEDPGDGTVVALASSPGAGSRTTGRARRVAAGSNSTLGLSASCVPAVPSKYPDHQGITLFLNQKGGDTRGYVYPYVSLYGRIGASEPARAFKVLFTCIILSSTPSICSYHTLSRTKFKGTIFHDSELCKHGLVLLCSFSTITTQLQFHFLLLPLHAKHNLHFFCLD